MLDTAGSCFIHSCASGDPGGSAVGSKFFSASTDLLGAVLRCGAGNFWAYFEFTVAAVPDLLADGSRQDNASMRRASGMLLGIAMHEESATAKSFGAGCRVQFQDVGAVIGGIDGRACDRPIALRDGADVGNILKRGIVLA